VRCVSPTANVTLACRRLFSVVACAFRLSTQRTFAVSFVVHPHPPHVCSAEHSCSHHVTCDTRYTETIVAPGRSLRWEQGEVEGVSIIAFEAANTGSARDIICQWHVCLLLLFMLAF